MTIATEDPNDPNKSKESLEDLESSLQQAAPEVSQPAPADEASQPQDAPKEVVKNYTLTRPVIKDMPEDKTKIDEDVLIPLPSDTTSGVVESMNNVRERVDASDEAVSWYRTLDESIKRIAPGAGLFEDVLGDPNADWRQSLEHNGTQVGGIARPKFSRGKGTRMSSERMLLSMRTKLNLGAPINVPLYATGIHATCKPLSEREILALWTEVIANPLRMGRRTHGMLFSSTQAYTERAIFNAWYESLDSLSVGELSKPELMDLVKLSDMPIIAHAVATSLYPNGLPFKRAVWTEDGLPDREIEQILDISKTVWFNHKHFSQEQLSHMTHRMEKTTNIKQVKEYQDSFRYPNRINEIVIDEDLKIHLAEPNLTQYFMAADRWIEGLHQEAINILGEKASEGEKAGKVDQLAKVGRLCKYSHYVKAIEDSGDLYDTPEAINQGLELLSASDHGSQLFYEGVTNFIEQSQIALVAVTSYNEFEDKVTMGSKFPRLVPIDATSTFFLVVEQKLHGIVSRERAVI